MKKVVAILSFALVCLFTQLRAQGNLQFNQVKLVTTVQTVPAGKVWKVESAQYSGTAAFLINNAGATTVYGTMVLNVNGTPIYPNYYLTTSGSTYSNSPLFPLWLPTGSTLSAGNGTAYLSVIEFNVVP
jgi:hypothetical protein